MYIIEWLFYFDFGFDYKNFIYLNCCLFKNLGVQGKLGYFEDVMEFVGLGKIKEFIVVVDRFGGVDVRYYGVMNIGLFRDIILGLFKLVVMFIDLDNDGKIFFIKNDK